MPFDFSTVDFDSFATEPEQSPELLQQEQEEELGFWGTVGDIAAAPFRGVAGAAEGLLEIGNIFGLDYDIAENLGLGESETFAGSALEGITQFATGFIPGIGIAGRIGSAAGLAGKTGKIAQGVAKLQSANKAKSALALARGSEAIKYAAAGAIADFTVFDGHEQRLSNLIESVPELQNPITSFLAADEDDSELEGRLKAAIEGIGLGFALDGILIGVKAIKAGRKAKTPKEASKIADDVVKAELAKKEADEVVEEATEATTKEADEIFEETTEATTKATDDVVEETTEAVTKPKVKPPKKVAKDIFNIDKSSSHTEVRGALNSVVDGSVKVREAGVDAPARSREDVLAGAQRVRDDLEAGTGVKLGSDEELEATLKMGGKAEEELTHLTDVTMAVRDVLEERTGVLVEHTRKAVDINKGTRADLVEFLKQSAQLEDLATVVRGLGGAWGRGLQSMGFKPKGLPRNFDQFTKESLEDNPKLIDDLIDAAGGEAAVRAEMEKFLAAAENGNMAALNVARNKTTKTGAVIEYWMNSILSGPVTQIVNLTSAALTTMLAPAEKALGHALLGNMKEAGAEMARYGYLVSSIQDSISVAKMALKEGDAILDPALKTVETAGRKSKVTEALLETRLNNSTAGQEAARWLGNLVNLPSRFLTTGDEFYKQLNYRRVLKTELRKKAMSNGITNPKEIAQFVEDGFKKMVGDGQFNSSKGFKKAAKNLSDDELMEALRKSKSAMVRQLDESGFNRELAESAWVRDQIKTYSPLAEQARAVARDVTFTTPLSHDRGMFISGSKTISDAVNKHPVARLVMPFVRTPANIIQHFFDRIPLLGKSQRKNLDLFRKEIYDPNPEVRADAIGRLSTGVIFTSAGIYAAASGKITGGGPTDRNRRKVMEDAGWQPYSLKIGDNYVSFRRLDPFAITFGMIADLTEIAMEGDEQVQQTAGDHISALTMSIMRNLANKTYLTGVTRLSDAITKPETAGNAYLRSNAASFVPNFLTQLNRSFEDENKDIKNWIDTFRSRLPGFSEGVAPRRNMFGEPVIKQGAIGPDFMSPFDYSHTTSDILKKELAEIGHPFNAPRSLKNGVELREHIDSSGQSAYDRWLELHGSVKINGQSMRQAMTRLLKSRRYKRLPYEAIEGLENSPRVREINKILSKYRAKAFSQMLREFPDVRQRDEINLLIKQARRTGRSYEELLALTNQ